MKLLLNLAVVGTHTAHTQQTVESDLHTQPQTKSNLYQRAQYKTGLYRLTTALQNLTK